MAVTGKIKPIRNKILVQNMNFGEQKTAGGIFILNDDAKSQGIHPRWAQVYAVGPEHNEEFGVGDWILIEHGRWTRGIEVIEENGDKLEVRMVDNDCIMMWDNEQPTDAQIGIGA
jgi:co-chaperonin GroES (HSP10)